MAEGGAEFSKGFMIVAASAGAGALATVAGFYIVDKVKNAFARRPKMKLFHKHPFLSARCTWFISELGVEEDFTLRGSGMTDSISSRSQRALSYDDSNEDQAGPAHYGSLTSLTKKFESMDSVYSETESLTEYKPSPPDCLPTFIVNDEFTMIEGTAMCMYLADLYQECLPHPDNKAEYYSWMVYSASTFDNIMKTLQHQLVDLPEEHQSDVLAEPALNGFHAFARALSQTLEDRTYLCGDRFTAADCVIGFTLWWAFTFEGGNLLDGYPVLMNYLQRLKDRPAFQKIFGHEDSFNWKSCISTGFNALGHTDDAHNSD